jgi:DNA-binding PadR family transcriptional regulator
MKGTILLGVLKKLGDAIVSTSDLFEAFLNAGYGASYGKIEYERSKIERDRGRRPFKTKEEVIMKQKYYNLIYKLKEDGLIEEKMRDKRKFFTITGLGKTRFKSLKEIMAKRMPTKEYRKETNNCFTIVIFDVPEKEKRKREWLRNILKNLDLKMIQKSVWIGKIKIPQAFLDDLEKFRMIDFVEIFEITKTGSLKRLN